MKVLVACEFSGIVRDAFRARGHRAWSCDLLPTESRQKKYHIQDDVRNHLNRGWDLLIGHPECTRICNSGVRWLEERNLWEDLDTACDFFKLLLKSKIPRIAIENPIPHKYALDRIGCTYNQIIQSWMFGHGERKAICLWLKNLPHLIPTKVVSGKNSPSSSRFSRT